MNDQPAAPVALLNREYVIADGDATAARVGRDEREVVRARRLGRAGENSGGRQREAGRQRAGELRELVRPRAAADRQRLLVRVAAQSAWQGVRLEHEGRAGREAE